ncbi:MAG: hypothetical protein ACRDT4_09960 [Micromonosporaceae bacterium]
MGTSGKVKKRRDPRPLYARVLRLKHIRPGSVLCFVFFELTIFVAVVLGFAELISWWVVPVLPIVVAIMVKLNDVIAGAAAGSVAPAPDPVHDGELVTYWSAEPEPEADRADEYDEPAEAGVPDEPVAAVQVEPESEAAAEDTTEPEATSEPEGAAEPGSAAEPVAVAEPEPEPELVPAEQNEATVAEPESDASDAATANADADAVADAVAGADGEDVAAEAADRSESAATDSRPTQVNPVVPPAPRTGTPPNGVGVTAQRAQSEHGADPTGPSQQRQKTGSHPRRP